LGSYKIHLLNRVENNKVPDWNKSKQDGHRIAKCGYQRKNTTDQLDQVTCKICLKITQTILKRR